MLSKNQIKVIKSLKAKKFRQKYDLFVAEGEKILETIITSKKFEIDKVYLTPNAQIESNLLKSIDPTYIDNKGMKSISFLSTPSTVFTLIKMPITQQASSNKAIYLDAVQDPGNVGTIIRIADWYGIDTVIRSPDSADFYSPKVIQSTMGAFANVNLLEMTRNELIDQQENLIAADMEGTPLNDLQNSDQFTLIMGPAPDFLLPSSSSLKSPEVLPALDYIVDSQRQSYLLYL